MPTVRNVKKGGFQYLSSSIEVKKGGGGKFLIASKCVEEDPWNLPDISSVYRTKNSLQQCPQNVNI